MAVLSWFQFPADGDKWELQISTSGSKRGDDPWVRVSVYHRTSAPNNYDWIKEQIEGRQIHFAHFGAGSGITSDIVLSNPSIQTRA